MRRKFLWVNGILLAFCLLPACQSRQEGGTAQAGSTEEPLDGSTYAGEAGEKVLGLYSEEADQGGTVTQADGLREYREYLAELPSGTYYVGAEVYREGEYIEEKDAYEYSGEQYVFCLKK